MVITFTAVLLGLVALFRPLQRNPFFLLDCALIIGSAYYVETHWFRTSMFAPKTFLLLLVFHVFFINICTFIAYGVDKRAAVRKAWRVPENSLHALEFLGGWLGAWVGQKVFHHKTKKQSFQNTYKLMIVLEFVAVYIILKYLRLI